MSAKKNYYYVLVFTSEGPVYVTGIPERTWANYNEDEKPMEFGSKSYATEVANGLTLNFNSAVMVHSSYEIESQPYLYGMGSFKWSWKDKEND